MVPLCTTYEESCITFSKLRYKKKSFYEILVSNSETSMDHISTKKSIPTKEEKTMNYRNCTTDRTS